MGSTIRWHHLERTAHVLQIYDQDAQLLQALGEYAADGLAAGESVVIIATSPHCAALRERLCAAGLDMDAAEREDRYIALPAQDTLERFMVAGLPDDERFRATLSGVIARARAAGQGLRAFGEMVALLWTGGNRTGAVRLEQAWNRLLHGERFPLFCAYPRDGFGREFSSAVHDVCASHTRVFGA
jgi:hypothetical protein